MIERRALFASVGAVAAHRAWAMGSDVPGLASLPIPESRAIAFRLMRHGDAIGTHTLDFHVAGDMLDVDIAVDVLFTFGPIPLVRYNHHAVERWQGGRLASLTGHTNRNGTDMYMSAHRVTAGLWVEGSGTTPYVAPEDALPTTYWNARMLRGPMIGTQDGGLVHPKVTPKGVQPVKLVSGAERPATCYSLTGDLDLDLWYDAQNSWMSMRFSVADGSTISYERL
jgi:hypothetical protein